MDRIGNDQVSVDCRAVLRARLGLAAFVLATASCITVSVTTGPDVASVPAGATSDDFALYRRVVERVRDGEAYHDAAHQELRARGFPTRSVFNWRTPLYAWFLGQGPGLKWGRWLLIAGMTLAVVAWSRDLSDEFGVVPASVGGVFLAGACAWCIGRDAVYLMEFWAAMLIALSVCAYRRGWWGVGVATGLLAVFYRELALPYAVVSAGLAFWEGRKRETLTWAVGFLLFAAFLGYHAHEVQVRLTTDDLGMRDGWLRFGGIRFLLATARTNLLLSPLPPWCTALYMSLAVLGIAGSRNSSGRRVGLTAVSFLGAFSLVGNPFNFYWGFLIAPLLAVGIAGVPRALSRLVSTALAPQTRAAASRCLVRG